ncbi:unnamed protein product [Notodromas monacha]|uniref:CCHC-type domain-containing protein n=1 Tax=Notodromas monacha TaxID=399045 RepID=A0A7R9BXR3_9CRUS|nr:unnamed protein product [Notodromas monacha]CAG0922765.1 unnamed protein product [Notodromas monacha]
MMIIVQTQPQARELVKRTRGKQVESGVQEVADEIRQSQTQEHTNQHACQDLLPVHLFALLIVSFVPRLPSLREIGVKYQQFRIVMELRKDGIVQQALEKEHGDRLMLGGIKKLQGTKQGPQEKVRDFATRICRIGTQMIGEAPTELKVIKLKDGTLTITKNPLFREELILQQGEERIIENMMMTYFMQGLRKSLYDKFHVFPTTFEQAIEMAGGMEQLISSKRDRDRDDDYGVYALSNKFNRAVSFKKPPFKSFLGQQRREWYPNCPQGMDPGNPSGNCCWNCGDKDHYKNDCLNPVRGYKQRPNTRLMKNKHPNQRNLKKGGDWSRSPIPRNRSTTPSRNSRSTRRRDSTPGEGYSSDRSKSRSRSQSMSRDRKGRHVHYVQQRYRKDQQTESKPLDQFEGEWEQSSGNK